MNHLESFFNGYFEEDPDYFVLLFGEYGIGKTYYVKNSLIPTIKERLPKVTPIYVSLTGLASPSDFHNRILSVIMPVLGASSFDILKNMFKALQTISVGLFSPQIENDVFLKFVLKKTTEKYFFLFDDLERSKLAPSHVLGLVGDLIEACQAKGMLVGNETEIPKNDFEAYTKIKEKVIRYSFEFRIKFRDVFNGIISSSNLTEKMKLSFLGCQVDQIKKMKEISNGNLRAVKTSVWQVNRINKQFPAFFNQPDSAISVFLLLLAHSDFNKNSKRRKGFIKYCQENLSKMFTKEMTKYAFFEETYKTNWGLPLLHSKALINLVRNGYLDKKQFEKDFFQVDENEHDINRRILKEWYLQNDEVINNSIEYWLAKAQSDSLSFQEMFFFQKQYSQLFKENIVVNPSQKILDILKGSAERIFKKRVDFFETYEIERYVSELLMTSHDDPKDVICLKEFLIDLANRSNENVIKSKLVNALNGIPESFPDFKSLIQEVASKYVSGFPIFEYLPPDLLFQKMIVAPSNVLWEMAVYLFKDHFVPKSELGKSNLKKLYEMISDNNRKKSKSNIIEFWLIRIKIEIEKLLK